MDPGAFRDRITFVRSSEALSPAGEPITNDAIQATRWAHIEPLSDTERETGQTVWGVATHRVIVRTIDGLTHFDRILWGSRTLEVVGIVRDNPKTFVTITAFERLS